jgi:hypothetical protein
MGFNCTRSQRAGGAARKRQQGDVAGALDGHAEPALMARADSGHAARQDLAPFLDELRKNVRAFVIDEIHLLDAEFTYFLLAKILALAAPRTARSPGTTSTRPAFATATTRSAFAASSGLMTASAFTARSARSTLVSARRTLPTFRIFARRSRCGCLPLFLFL